MDQNSLVGIGASLAKKAPFFCSTQVYVTTGDLVSCIISKGILFHQLHNRFRDHKKDPTRDWVKKNITRFLAMARVQFQATET